MICDNIKCLASFSPPVLLPCWPSEDRRTRMVFITRDLPQATIEETFAAFAEAD
jgi:G3E family GTPase